MIEIKGKIRRVGEYLNKIKGIGPTKPIILTIGEFLEKIGEIPPIRTTKWSFIGSGGCGSRIVSNLADCRIPKKYVAGFLCIDSYEDPLSLLSAEVKTHSVGEHHGFGGNYTSATKFFKDLFEGKKLFSIDGELENELNKSIVSEELENAFESEEFPLSENATIRKERGDEWKITDREKTYIVKKDGKLNVYEEMEGKRELINKIDENIKNADACFLITSSGGATGSSSIPFIAKHIKTEHKIPVITLVVLPFSHEPTTLFDNTHSSILELTESADILIAVENNRFSGYELLNINKQIIEIMKYICYPKIYPYGKIFDIADLAWQAQESSAVLVPSLIQFNSKEWLPSVEKKFTEWTNEDKKEFTGWLKDKITENILVGIEEEAIKGGSIYFYFTNDTIRLELNKDLDSLNEIIKNAIKEINPDIPEENLTISFVRAYEKGFRMLVFHKVDVNSIRQKYENKIPKSLREEQRNLI